MLNVKPWWAMFVHHRHHFYYTALALDCWAYGFPVAVSVKRDAAVCYNYPMITVTIEDIQRDIVGYLHRVQSGESLLVMEANSPLVEITPVGYSNMEARPLRPFGLCAGEFAVPDDFDAPLPEEMLQEFERV